MKAMSVFRMLGVISILFLPGFDALADPVVTVGTGDFDNWSYVVFTEGSGYGEWERWEDGGNPGAHLRIRTRTGSHQNTMVLSWENEYVWDPSVEGQIGCLTLQIDEKAIWSFGEGHGMKLLVVQDGRYYAAPMRKILTYYETTWETLVLGPYGESDFGEVLPVEFNPDEKPDFSPSGAPLHFGFLVGNTHVLDAVTHAYDNWEVTIVVGGLTPVESTTWGQIKALSQ